MVGRVYRKFIREVDEVVRTGRALAGVVGEMGYFDNDAKWSIVLIVQKGLQVNGQRDNSGFVVHAE